MKTIFILFLLPLKLFAQDITGVWTGTIFNDTTQQTISYQVAISEYKGRLSGYSHTIFIIDNKENVGVKSINIKKKKEKFFIEDDALIWNNYPEPPPKGVKMYSLLDLSFKDSLMILNGIFNTNRTKTYRPLTGTVHLEKVNNFSQTKLITKLNELDVSKSLSFLQPKEKITTPEIVVAQKETKPKPVLISNEKIKEKETAAVIKEPKLKVVSQPKEKKKEKEVIALVKEKKKEAINIPVAQNKLPAAELADRKIETIQVVSLKSDSITITLYDNGEVDGDTVSILLNGKVIMANQGLSTKAITKTIYITPDLGDSIQLIMYAENLGSIPPNTGLLILQDAGERYEIRFAGDLKKNSAIVLRRKKIKE